MSQKIAVAVFTLVAALAAILLGSVILAVKAHAEVVGPVPESESCAAARAWHLSMALRWSLRDEQAYHLTAADAAAQLGASYDGNCPEWQSDATGPTLDSSGTLARGQAAYNLES